MSTDSNELVAFHEFLTNQLQATSAPLTPEQCLDLWRSEHPTDQELQQSTSAVEQSLRDMHAGDHGVSARALIERARQKHGLA